MFICLKWSISSGTVAKFLAATTWLSARVRVDALQGEECHVHADMPLVSSSDPTSGERLGLGMMSRAQIVAKVAVHTALHVHAV